MRSTNKIILLVSFFLSLHAALKSQINGNNLLEYQFGELPGDSAAISTVYDRANLNYTYQNFKGGVTLEQFHSPIEKRNYTKLSQYLLQYNSEMLDVKIGNFYETIGRGLLLRSYEIPGAVLEDLSYRSRHYFHRDIAGFTTKFHHKNFSTKLIYGKPLNYVFPPSQSDSYRRPDIIEAIYSEYSFKKQTIGASVLRLTNSSKSAVYSMVTASGNLSPVISYYTEMAKNISNFGLADFSSQAPYALYVGINLSFNNLGISAEAKSYNNFLIGAGVNEPPALVKEHTYKVLNRSTHVLQPLNEKGYQIEVFYTFPDLSTLTLNNTIAINNFGKKFIFHEYFAEYDFVWRDMHDVKIFADYAEDPFKLEEQRISAGAYFEWKILQTSSLKTDYEFQTYNRLEKKVQNHVLSLGYTYKSKLVFNITSELSDDAFITNNKTKTWVGSTIKYKINPENSVQLFLGQRRGGSACNAGVCYEVLDFKGIELRLTSRF